MPALSPEGGRLMEFFGSIQGAVSSRASTADVWQAIRSQSTATGRPIPEGAFLAVNQLRSIAVGIRRAAENLQGAGGIGTLTSDMISMAPYQRPEAAQVAGPAWEAKFLNTLVIDGLEESTWSTTYFYGSLPATVDELVNAIQADASLMASHYGNAVSLGVSSLSISSF